jgi:hypothetical protein
VYRWRSFAVVVVVIVVAVAVLLRPFSSRFLCRPALSSITNTARGNPPLQPNPRPSERPCLAVLDLTKEKNEPECERGAAVGTEGARGRRPIRRNNAAAATSTMTQPKRALAVQPRRLAFVRWIVRRESVGGRLSPLRGYLRCRVRNSPMESRRRSRALPSRLSGGKLTTVGESDGKNGDMTGSSVMKIST